MRVLRCARRGAPCPLKSASLTFHDHPRVFAADHEGQKESIAFATNDISFDFHDIAMPRSKPGKTSKLNHSLTGPLPMTVLLAAMASVPPVATFNFSWYPLVGGGGGDKGERTVTGAKGRSKRAAKKAAAAAQRVAASAAAKAKLDAARAAAEEAAMLAACDAVEAAAAARAAAPPPEQLMLDAPPPWLANEHAKNAAQDEFDALHLLWHNTGLGTQRALFELHHCDNTPEQREALIKKVKREVEAETEKKEAAQAGVKQRYREHNNDQQRLYVCACCGERNKEDTGNYTKVPLEAMEALRFNGSNKDVLRWRRIEAAHAETEAESGLPYSCVFNYWPPTQPGVALAPSQDHFHLIPEFVDTVHPPAGSAEAPTHSAMLCGTGGRCASTAAKHSKIS